MGRGEQKLRTLGVLSLARDGRFGEAGSGMTFIVVTGRRTDKE